MVEQMQGRCRPPALPAALIVKMHKVQQAQHCFSVQAQHCFSVQALASTFQGCKQRRQRLPANRQIPKPQSRTLEPAGEVIGATGILKPSRRNNCLRIYLNRISLWGNLGASAPATSSGVTSRPRPRPQTTGAFKASPLLTLLMFIGRSSLRLCRGSSSHAHSRPCHGPWPQ
jgi:hypothetical protein